MPQEEGESLQRTVRLSYYEGICRKVGGYFAREGDPKERERRKDT